MPMNPRLLRPRSGGNVATDADARAYIESVRAVDGTYMEPAVQRAVSTFVATCKTQGLWTAIEACYLFIGPRTLAGALVPLVGPAPTNTNFVSGDYGRKTGLKGNATNKSINTNYTAAAARQNDRHAAIILSSASTTGQLHLSSAWTSSGETSIGTGGTANYWFSNNSNGWTQSSRAVSGSAGFLVGCSRNSSSAFVARASQGTQTGFSKTSQAPSGSTILFNSTSFQFPSGDTMAFCCMGAHLDLAALDNAASTLYSAIGAAIP